MPPSSDAPASFARSLGATDFANETFRFVHGIPFQGRIRRGSKGVLLGVAIDASLGAPIVGSDVRFRREDGTDRFGKAIGVNREASSGEPGFDADVYIEADVPDDVVRGLLSDGTFRESVHGILRSGGAESILVTQDGLLRFNISPQHMGDVRGVQAMLGHAPAMIEALLRGAPERAAYRGDTFAARARDLRTVPGRSGLASVLCLLYAFGAFFAFLLGSTVTEISLDVSPAEVGIVLSAVVAHWLGVAFVFGRRYDGLRNVLLCGIVGTIFVIPATFTVASLVNSSFDSRPMTRVEGEVVTVHDNKGSGTHLMVDLGGTTVPLRRGDHSMPGTTRKAAFLVGPGALGARWTTGREVE